MQAKAGPVVTLPPDLYRGHGMALLTQHGKGRVIASALEPRLGCRVEVVGGYNTDRLGTFTREIPRLSTQLKAARRKAGIGMELSGLPLGLASEGPSNPTPWPGFCPRMWRSWSSWMHLRPGCGGSRGGSDAASAPLGYGLDGGLRAPGRLS